MKKRLIITESEKNEIKSLYTINEDGVMSNIIDYVRSLMTSKDNKPTTKINVSSTDKSSAKEIIDFFKNKGLTPEQSAGIAGNLWAESGFKTKALGDNSTSLGLAQWHKERKDSLIDWCKSQNLDPYSVKGQLEYLWHELNTSEKNALSKVKSSNSVEEASFNFAKYFERCAECKNETSKTNITRMEYANKFNSEINQGLA